jgi:hypothetical protein
MDPRFVCLGHALILFTIMADLINRICLVGSIYGHGNPMPIQAISMVSNLELNGAWLISYSLFSLSDSNFWTLALFIFMLGICLLLLFGFRKNWVYWILIYLLASLKSRYPLALNGGDDEFVWWLMWLSFFPWREISDKKNSGESVVNFGTRIFTGHLICFYCALGLLKSGQNWANGQAVQSVLLFDFMRNPGFDWLLSFPKFNIMLTHMVHIIEIFGSLGLIILMKFRRLRLVLVGSFIILHTCMGAVLHTFPLPEVAIATWLLFIPGSVWPKAVRLPATLFLAPIWRLQIAIISIAILIFTMEIMAVLGEFHSLASFAPVRVVSKICRDIAMRPNWNFFSPNAPMLTGWPLLTGKTINDSKVEIDLIGGSLKETINENKPGRREGAFSSRIWSRLYFNAIMPKYRSAVAYGLAYSACARFHELKEMEITYFIQKIDGPKLTPAEKILLSRTSCSAFNS